jgi:AcrR family transcriptional regulator
MVKAPRQSTATRQRGRTRRLGATERREQLVTTAQRLFAERGYRATTMEDIANAAGVTKPLLYQHFESKRALYLELVHQVSTELLEALRSAYHRANGPREKVENSFLAYFEIIATHEDSFRLLFGRHAPDDPELASAARKVEAAVLDIIEDTMPRELDPEHRRLLAHAMAGMAEGGTRYWVESARRNGVDRRSDADVAHLAQRVSRLAWSGLRGVGPDEGVTGAEPGAQ